jgi:hypothetical protein
MAINEKAGVDSVSQEDGLYSRTLPFGTTNPSRTASAQPRDPCFRPRRSSDEQKGIQTFGKGSVAAAMIGSALSAVRRRAPLGSDMLTRYIMTCASIHRCVFLTGSQCHTHPKVKDGPKRRRETAVNIRPPSIINANPGSECADSVSTDIKEEAEEAHHDNNSHCHHSMDQDDSSTTPMNVYDNKIDSAPVSPRTVIPDQYAEQVAEPMVMESIESGPLTATRISMEFSPPKTRLPPSSLSASQHDYAMSTPQESATVTCAELVVSQLAFDGLKSEVAVLNPTPSPAATPISTPQLSNTSLSTPQMDTPANPAMPVLGLGVRGLMPFDLSDSGRDGHGMHYNGFGNLFQQHTADQQNQGGVDTSTESNRSLSCSSSHPALSHTSNDSEFSSNSYSQLHNFSHYYSTGHSSDSHTLPALPHDMSSLSFDIRVALDNNAKHFSDAHGSNDFSSLAADGSLEAYSNMF